jgi:hypothetical protein
MQPIIRNIAGLCSEGDPGLLLALAQGGSSDSPCSEQQVAFINLLVSLLKLSRAVVLPAGTAGATLVFAGTVAADAASMLARLAAAGDGSSDTVSLWLLLLGRCFLLAAAALQQVCGREGEGPAAAATAKFVSGGLSQLLGEVVPAVLGLFVEGSSSSSLTAWLSAAGYDTGPIVQGLEALSGCYPELVLELFVPGAVCFESGRFGRLIEALVSAGQALSMFAVPHCCNNPSCSNTVGPKEASIVSGKGCICAGCKVARYCGKPCQAAHWKVAHKPVCKMLRARSAGTCQRHEFGHLVLLSCLHGVWSVGDACAELWTHQSARC